MSNRTEYIYKGRDNTIERILKVDGEAADLAGVTQMVLEFSDSVEMDSDVLTPGEGAGNQFDWTEGNGKLILRLGDEDIAVGEYDAVKLWVFDAANANGILWDEFPITVTDES